jgi:hypothetical protein
MGRPSPSTLSSDERVLAVREVPWWRPRREWPAGLRFRDGRVEGVIDRTPLPLPTYPGMIGCAAQACADASLAERTAQGRKRQVR